MHRDHLTGPVRQIAQSLPDQQPVGDPIDLRLHRDLAGVVGGATPGVALLGADVVDDPVPSDRDEPAGKAALRRFVSLVAPPGTDEDLLGDVLGAGLIEGPAAQRVHEAPVPQVGGSQRALLAPGEGRLDSTDRLALGARHTQIIATDQNQASTNNIQLSE